jgi:hypothetical protein
MNNDGLYHQPRWVNAIFIAGCVPIILSPYVMKDMSRPLVFIGGPLLFLFVGVCNKWRSGAFLPRWAEAAQLRDQLDLEKARRLTQAELALLAAEISAYDVQPRSLRTLSEAVQHIATGLSINVHEDWLEADHRRPNEAVRFHYRTTIVQAELRDGGYHCACSGTTRGDSPRGDSPRGDISEWSENVTSKLAWRIAGHPFDSKAFRQVYFSMPKPNSRI